MPEIAIINCSDSHIATISPSAKMICLEELMISDNHVKHVPAFGSLLRLIATRNRIRQIDPSPLLDYLDVCHNRLADLPLLPHATSIYASCNRLRSIATYPLAKVIDVSDNQITQLADQPRVVEMLANHNRLISIGRMPRAKQLDLASNQIVTLRVPHLVSNLDLSENPLTHLDLPSIEHRYALQIPLSVYPSVYRQYRASITQVLFHISSELMADHMRRILATAGYPLPAQTADAMVEIFQTSDSPFLQPEIRQALPKQHRSLATQLISVYERYTTAAISFHEKNDCQ